LANWSHDLNLSQSVRHRDASDLEKAVHAREASARGMLVIWLPVHQADWYSMDWAQLNAASAAAGADQATRTTSQRPAHLARRARARNPCCSSTIVDRG
jgi:hypothetical protein